MGSVALGLLLGVVVGAVNQLILWFAVRRAKPGQLGSLLAGFLGGCAVRLGLDAAALYAVWRFTRDVWAIVAAAGGLTLALGMATAVQFVRAQRERRRIGRGKGRL